MSEVLAPKPPTALRILVVENHRDTLLYLQMYLESLGHAVALARTVREAQESWAEAECDVLISDIGLPDGDGWQLLREMRARSNRPIFAIAMSGFGLSADRGRSRQAGYRCHLLKPFGPTDLTAPLAEAARERAATGNR